LNTGTQNEDLDDKISANVREMARSLDPGWVIVPSRRGDTARRVTRFRLRQWIIAPSRSLSTCRELQFSFGVHPVFAPGETDLATAEARRSFVQRWLARHGATDDLAVLVEGSGTFEDRPTRRIEVFRVEPTTG
jgi:pyruvate kinase